MKIENYKDWKELLSEDEFHHILNELIKKKDHFPRSSLLEIINSLSEKYLLFYGATELTIKEKTFINSILIEITDFSDLSITEELIGVLFNFRLDGYYYYLKNHVHLVKNEEVKHELLNSLKEYNDGEIDNPY
jgi:hypothetical protein